MNARRAGSGLALPLQALHSFGRLCRGMGVHEKCRSTDKPYLGSQVRRLAVPERLVAWSAAWPDYAPPDFSAAELNGKPYADPELDKGEFRFNQLDGPVDRRSFTGTYQLDSRGRPLNPEGRTGLAGRGRLGRWGPNHAADPIVSRVHQGRLQFVAIQRHDTGEWAIPGGMVDPGELATATLKREFTEEALDGAEAAELAGLWQRGQLVYRGYVDDPRNTDNAWMETVCMNFHDSDGLLAKVNFKAGDDAANVRFVDVTPGLELYASHAHLIEQFARLRGFSE